MPRFTKAQKFERAKEETLTKYQTIRDELDRLSHLESRPCGFCKHYQCSNCPVLSLCDSSFRTNACHILYEARNMAAQAVLDLEAIQNPKDKTKEKA